MMFRPGQLPPGPAGLPCSLVTWGIWGQGQGHGPSEKRRQGAPSGAPSAPSRRCPEEGSPGRLPAAETEVSGSPYQVSRPRWGNTQAAFLGAGPTPTCQGPYAHTDGVLITPYSHGAQLGALWEMNEEP